MARNKRSDAVARAIRRSYAILARAHFERAKASIDRLENEIGVEADRRMVIVGRYLDKAGADAVKYNF